MRPSRSPQAPRRRSPRPAGVRRSPATLLALANIVAVGLCAQSTTALADVPPAPYHGPAATTGTEFWFSFGANDSASTNYVDISATTATSATVAVPGLSFTTDVTVTPGQVTAVALPSGSNESASDGVEDLAVHVTAAAPVTVYGLEDLDYSTDGFTALPVSAIGTDYYALGYEAEPEQAPESEPSEFEVVGTQDGTTVTITPATATANRAAGVPYTVSLNTGQAYELIGEPGNDLTGTHISSSAPVSVEAGAQCANIPSLSYFYCNYVAEEMPPTTEWGSQFVTEPLAARTAGDTFRVLVSQNDTTVSVNGSSVATLDTGQFYQTQLTASSTIATSKPALVAQYSDSTTFDNVADADPSETLVPPTAQFLRGYTYATPPDARFTNYVNLVVPNAATSSVQLDGTTLPSSDFAVIGQSGFSGAQVPVPLGSHTLSAPADFGVIAYGFAPYDAYSYPAGYSTYSLATTARRYVALGDSYSSGEGAYNTNDWADFDPKTATDEIKSNYPDDQCHRSGYAYANRVEQAIGAQSLTFAACSGATLPDLVASIPEVKNGSNNGEQGFTQVGQWGEGAQLDKIASAESTDPSVSLVTISIGGNDFGFADVVQACLEGFLLSPGACQNVIDYYQQVGKTMLDDGGVAVESAIPNSSARHNNLTIGDGTYTLCTSGSCSGSRDVKVPSFSGILDAIHQRAPNAMIIVVGYPWLFPTSWEAASLTNCTIGFSGLGHYWISPTNMGRIVSGINYVDDKLKTIVDSAAAGGLDVRFADSRGAFFGHDVCEPTDQSSRSPWTVQTYAWINPILFSNSLGNTHPESLHPNKTGQAAYANLVAGCYANKNNCGSEPQPVLLSGGGQPVCSTCAVVATRTRVAVQVADAHTEVQHLGSQAEIGEDSRRSSPFWGDSSVRGRPGFRRSRG